MGEQGQPETQTEGNPVTLRRHRREAWWQITYPMLMMVALAVAGLVLLIVLGGPPAVSVVADYALALLVVVSVLPLLITLALAVGLVYAVTALIHSAPPYSYKGQQIAQRVYKWVDAQTDRLAGIVITIRSALIGISTFLRQQEEGVGEDASSKAQPGSEAD